MPINRRQVEAHGTDSAARFNVEFREVLRRTRIHTALGLQFSRIAHICKEVDMLKYSLRENLLTPAPDDYMAQVTDVRSIFENIRVITASLRKNKCSTYI